MSGMKLNGLLCEGDYVLATKWRDGDPKDPWCIGFYDRAIDCNGTTMHLVVDANGNQFYHNGFRRVKKISAKRGEFILGWMCRGSSMRLWYLVRAKLDA